MEKLLECGFFAVLTVYSCRLFLPLSISLLWQISRPLHESYTRCFGLPTSDDMFFYLPKDDDPLILRWYWPNHIKSIPLNFTAGVLLAYLAITLKIDLTQLFVPTIYIYAVFSVVRSVYRAWISKSSFWTGLESLFFCAFKIIEAFAMLVAVNFLLL